MDRENKDELTDVVSNHSTNESSSPKSNTNATLESTDTATATTSTSEYKGRTGFRRTLVLACAVGWGRSVTETDANMESSSSKSNTTATLESPDTATATTSTSEYKSATESRSTDTETDANMESSSSKSNTNATLESPDTATATTSTSEYKGATASRSTDTETDANVERLKTELTCSICMEMFVKATTLNCSHTFCEQCITRWRNNHGKCPICRVKIKTAFPTNVVNNCIDKVLESESDEFKLKRKELIEARCLPQSKRRKVNVPEPRNRNPIDVSSDGVLTERLSEVLNELQEVCRNSIARDARRYSYCRFCQRLGHFSNECPNRQWRRRD